MIREANRNAYIISNLRHNGRGWLLFSQMPLAMHFLERNNMGSDSSVPSEQRKTSEEPKIPSEQNILIEFISEIEIDFETKTDLSFSEWNEIRNRYLVSLRVMKGETKKIFESSRISPFEKFRITEGLVVKMYEKKVYEWLKSTVEYFYTTLTKRMNERRANIWWALQLGGVGHEVWKRAVIDWVRKRAPIWVQQYHLEYAEERRSRKHFLKYVEYHAINEFKVWVSKALAYHSVVSNTVDLGELSQEEETKRAFIKKKQSTYKKNKAAFIKSLPWYHCPPINLQEAINLQEETKAAFMKSLHLVPLPTDQRK